MLDLIGSCWKLSDWRCAAHIGKQETGSNMLASTSFRLLAGL